MNIVLLPFVGTEYQPTYDSGEFTVNFKAPIGTSMEKTVALATPLQRNNGHAGSENSGAEYR